MFGPNTTKLLEPIGVPEGEREEGVNEEGGGGERKEEGDEEERKEEEREEVPEEECEGILITETETKFFLFFM